MNSTINTVKRFPKFLGTFNRADAEDPMKTFRYHVEIQQFARFGFSKVSGIQADTDSVEFREGGQNSTVQKSPGLTKFGDVTLERGQIFAAGYGAMDVMSWYLRVFDVSTKRAVSPGTFRRSIDVVQFDKEGTERYRWRLVQCWPKSVKPLADLEALGSNNSVEQMVVVHEGFRLISSV